MEPVREFTTLCLQCLSDRVTYATDGEKFIFCCADCKAIKTLVYGELPWGGATHVR